MNRKLQVFVSSTYTDLTQERQAAVEAILRAGHIPAGMELFAAGSESQLEVVRRWIDDCDIYMLILGDRYGSIEPQTNYSYTEVEYRYALQQNKPLFAIILSEEFIEAKFKEHGKSMIELAERTKLDSFKALVKQKISRIVKDQSEIRLSVLESMLDIQNRYSLKGWVREDQVPNVNELINQITDLKDENMHLKDQIRVYESSLVNKIGEYSFEEIKMALQNIKITIPEKVSGNKKIETNIYNIALLTQKQLSAGVSNRIDSSEIEIFLYYSVCPHLRIYELAEIVKYPNAQWTSFITSKMGNKFLSLANMKGEKKMLGFDKNTSKKGSSKKDQV